MTDFAENAVQAAGTEIKCPNCGQTIVLTRQAFASIAQQVRDKEFAREVQAQTQAAVRLAEAVKDRTIAELNAKLRTAEQAKELAVRDAREQSGEQLRSRDVEITRLKTALDMQKQASAADKAAMLKLADAAREKETASLRAEIEKLRVDFSLRQAKMRGEQELLLKEKDEQIAFLRDLKAKLSTKLLGETLEQHCKIAFEQVRAFGFQSAYFEKDNDASGGSKGDFIFRDFDRNGVEFLSVMFEMKHEAEDTIHRHKNEDFFRKLDADRTAKGCEYAVLVSTLEAESELYNAGIVDVSHRYPKMYVVRPNFFLPLLTVLRNAALNTVAFREEAEMLRSQHFDVRQFTEKLAVFQEKFGKSYEGASKQFASAIAEIDKSISHLEKTKAALLSSAKHLESANRKAEDMTLKRLTRGNPTMKRKFADAGIDVSGEGSAVRE